MPSKAALNMFHSLVDESGKRVSLYERPFVIGLDHPIATAPGFRVEMRRQNGQLISIVRADRIAVQKRVATLGAVGLKLTLSPSSSADANRPKGTLALNDKLGLVFLLHVKSLSAVDFLDVGPVQSVLLSGQLEPLSQEKEFELLLELGCDTLHTSRLQS